MTPNRDNSPIQIVSRFNEALNAGDIDGMMQLMTPDCVFESTYPPPDGMRHAGRAAVRAFWEDLFVGVSDARFEIDEIFALGERCVMRWTYRWIGSSGIEAHIRGVDVYRIKDGQIAEGLSYVKG